MKEKVFIILNNKLKKKNLNKFSFKELESVWFLSSIEIVKNGESFA